MGQGKQGKQKASFMTKGKDSKKIKQQLDNEATRHASSVKLLLLGCGDAGKSTFLRQMQVIHNKEGVPPQERARIGSVLKDNALDTMQKLVAACADFNIEIPKEHHTSADIVKSANQLTQEVAESIDALWKIDAIQTAYDRNNELLLPGGASGCPYYMTNVVRFAKPDFVPNDDDIFRVKSRTTGIIEVAFKVKQTAFTMVDVGGQRSERRKWMSIFDNCIAVIYLAALNEYDMVLEEDSDMNRMEESIKLFQSTSSNPIFSGTTFILFLNKSDLFREKVKVKKLSSYFDSYEADIKKIDAAGTMDDFERGCLFIGNKYTAVFGGTRLYPFVTCALDTDNCKRIFNSVRDTILASKLDGVK